MKATKKIHCVLLIFIVSTCIIVGCSEKENSENIKYAKPPEEELDEIDIYLRDNKNLTDKNYIKTYTERFDKYINKGEIDSAARILATVGLTYAFNYEVNQTFINKQFAFIKAYEKQISPRYMADLYYTIGVLYYHKGSLDSSILFLNKGIVKATDYYTTSTNGNCHYMLSFANISNGQHEKSLETLLQAQKEFETIGNIERQASTLDAVAAVYRFSSEYTEALKASTEAYQLALLSKDSSSVLGVCINKLCLYQEMEHPNFSVFADSLVVFANQWKNMVEDDKLIIYSHKVVQLVQKKRLKEALQILEKYKDSYQKSTNFNAKDHYKMALAEYEAAKGTGSSNIKEYETSIPELKKEDDFLRLGTYYKILRDDAIQKANYKKAYDYQTLLAAADDSLSGIKMKGKVKELDKKYQTEKKEQLIKLQNAKLKQNNTLIYALVTSIISLIFLITVYYLWQKQKNLKQEKMNSMNFTKQLLENTEDERKRIASDLHDSVSHELLSLKSMLRGDFTELNAKVDTIINDIRGISRNLHPVMFDKIGLQPNIEQLVERVAIQHNFMVNKDIVYSSSLSTAVELQIYRIIQESLTNIIKYADAHAAKITIEETPDKVFIEIKDNGKGFNVKETLNSDRAFGLHNIIERSRVIGGKAEIKSSDEGTVISISVPKFS
jgi:two-component system, NarL family, sensor kinase